MNSTLIKILIWLFTFAIISVVGYWNVKYAQIIIENQNFPQIIGGCLIAIVEVILTFFIIKFIINELKSL
jgi:hypothetical protein